MHFMAKRICLYGFFQNDRFGEFFQYKGYEEVLQYAGIEALKLGHGGIAYSANVLGCREKTVSQGIKQIKRLPEDSGNEGRIRKKGGGRKRYDETCQGIDEKCLDVVKDHTAGDPMDETAFWTNLSQQEIVARLNEKHG
jgi:hypothetical protein